MPGFRDMKICLTCSHGGHLTELEALSNAFKGHEIFYITYESVRTKTLRKRYLFPNMGKNPLCMLLYLPSLISILIMERPSLIISTGAEIAIPVFYIAQLLRIKTVFIEVWTRVKRPTVTGMLVYPVASVFLVQWKSLLEKYGSKAMYWGSLF